MWQQEKVQALLWEISPKHICNTNPVTISATGFEMLRKKPKRVCLLCTYLVGIQPRRIVGYHGKFLIAQIVYISSWKVVPYQDYPLSKVIVFLYFPGFDKFTSLP